MTLETNLADAPAPAADLPYSLPLELTVQDGEMIAELCAYAEIGLVTEEHVLVVAIDPRKVSQQITRIRADAEVV